MPEAVIVATARSPIGRAFKGSLTGIRPVRSAWRRRPRIASRAPLMTRALLALQLRSSLFVPLLVGDTCLGVLGLGAVAQAVHLPLAVRRPDLFRLAGHLLGREQTTSRVGPGCGSVLVERLLAKKTPVSHTLAGRDQRCKRTQRTVVAS